MYNGQWDQGIRVVNKSFFADSLGFPFAQTCTWMVLFHMRDLHFLQLCSLGKLSQIDSEIALHRCKLFSNSAGDLAFIEYVSLNRKAAERVARSFSYVM